MSVLAAILVGMSDLAVIPGWVKPPHREVADCHRIAHVVAASSGSYSKAAIAATINWVTAGQDAPVTERTDEPTELVARAEMLVADRVPFEDIPAMLGVDSPPPVTEHRGWCDGVALTLGWLLGIHSRPPIQLPRRNPDGSVPDGEQLYAEARAARPHCAWEPEQRIEARDKAYADAARYARLASLADSAL